MSNKNNLLIQFWFSFILFLVILFVSNGVFTRSFSFSGFNYTGKHSAPTIIKHSPKEKHLQGKEIKIKFQMKVNSVTNYDNVFQTASGNFGIRMELGGSTEKSLGMVIGKKKARFKGFLLSNNLSPGKWHDILVQITSDQKVTVYLDNVLAIDEACSKLSYDLSDIAIGTGFSRSRPFDGEIRDFSINGKYSYKLFPLFISILLQLFAGIFFIFSLFSVKDKIAELLRLLKLDRFKKSFFIISASIR